MGLVLEPVSFDDIFERTEGDKFLLNMEDAFSLENKERLDSIIMTDYADDNLSLMPKCGCGSLRGEYYVGDKCGDCNTTVTSSVDDNLTYLLWLQKPIGLERFISPLILSILLNRYKISRPSVKLVQYILTPNMRITGTKSVKGMDSLDKLDYLLAENNIPKGYNSFIANFYKIVEILENNFAPTRKKVAERKEFFDWLVNQRNLIFSNYLPFPNKAVFALDSNELGSFFDRSILDPINSVRRVTGIDLYNTSIPKKEMKVAKSLMELSGFYEKYLRDSFFRKPGLIRQHISSTKSHFSARAVITPIRGPHRYDELHLPWSLAVTLFREHLINGLTKRGYSYKQTINLIMYHNRIYSPVIDEIFNEMLVASEDGIDVIFIRNPSLHRGSLCGLKVRRFKTDTTDNTISIPLPLCPIYNADFDGDEMNLQLVLTKPAVEQLHNFKPHHSVLSLTGPNEFSNAIKFPKTLAATLSSWFDSDK